MTAEQTRTKIITGQKGAPAKELQLLEIFVGKWAVSGQNLSGATINANTTVNGFETYEWMPGKYFLINRWDRQFNNDAHIGIGIICYDALKKEFVANNYDNMGFARIYKMSVEGNTWLFNGEKERATMEFSEDGASFEEEWEISKDGLTWEPLCALSGAKME